MDATKFGMRIAAMRKEREYTQEGLAELINISPQAVSKWENGRALPETAVLPLLAKALDTSIDSLFTNNSFQILSAQYGDGIETHNVTARLNRLIEDDILEIDVNNISLACGIGNNRHKYLTIKYQLEQTEPNVFYSFAAEGNRLLINPASKGFVSSDTVEIVAASYGTAKAHYDAMGKIGHYKVFGWDEYRADHETFPSNPASDDMEYLTFVYMAPDGMRIVTCEEGESIAYNDNKTGFYRKQRVGEAYIRGVPMLPPFGEGWECSWAAALTAALQAMGHKTSYEQVMGVSGACYRLAFCSPGWDYSSVDGLVAYDYATPAFTAFGYKEERHGHVEKVDRAAHRERMMKEIRQNMPILGINLRVAAEWGVICGYNENGERLFCRTKYDKQTIENDPVFMRGHPEFKKDWLGPNDYMQVDNWPFLISYFTSHIHPAPSDADNLINSLKVFIDCSGQTKDSGYRMGFQAYELWMGDLLDDDWYDNYDDDQFARRFSVDQFCSLALFDARKAAHAYLCGATVLIPDKADKLARIAGLFKFIAEKAGHIHHLLDSGEYLEGARARHFWTRDKRLKQAELLCQMLDAEKKAAILAEGIIT